MDKIVLELTQGELGSIIDALEFSSRMRLSSANLILARQLRSSMGHPIPCPDGIACPLDDELWHR